MKILLPVDGSDCANKTMEWAASMFDPHATEYYLLYVIPIIPELTILEYNLVEAHEILRKARIFLEDKGCHVIDAEYLRGDAPVEICRYADARKVDQVVIGSHGRTGLAKLLIGSTGETVLEHCHQPVIVFRNVERKKEPNPPSRPWHKGAPHENRHIQYKTLR